MAFYSGTGIDLPFTASGDLNNSQYKFVMCACTPQRVLTATGASVPAPIGVLQNDPYSLDAATVRVAGITKVWYSSSTAISYGNMLMCGSSGQAEAHGVVAGSAVQGIAMEDAPAGSGYISMLLTNLPARATT